MNYYFDISDELCKFGDQLRHIHGRCLLCPPSITTPNLQYLDTTCISHPYICTVCTQLKYDSLKTHITLKAFYFILLKKYLLLSNSLWRHISNFVVSCFKIVVCASRDILEDQTFFNISFSVQLIISIICFDLAMDFGCLLLSIAISGESCRHPCKLTAFLILSPLKIEFHLASSNR